MKKEYTVFGHKLTLEEDPRILPHLPYLHSLYEQFAEYLHLETDILQMIAFSLILNRHLPSPVGEKTSFKAKFGTLALDFIIAKKAVPAYREACKEVNLEMAKYSAMYQDKTMSLMLTVMILNIANNLEQDTINYNLESTLYPEICPGDSLAVFKFIDRALDALEVWAHRGFDGRLDIIPFLDKVYDTIRFAPQRIHSGERFEMIDIRISRFCFILTEADLDTKRFVTDGGRIAVEASQFLSCYEQKTCLAVLDGLKSLALDVEDNATVASPVVFKHLTKAARNIMKKGNDVSYYCMFEAMSHLISVLDDAGLMSFAQKARKCFVLRLQSSVPDCTDSSLRCLGKYVSEDGFIPETTAATLAAREHEDCLSVIESIYSIIREVDKNATAPKPYFFSILLRTAKKLMKDGNATTHESICKGMLNLAETLEMASLYEPARKAFYCAKNGMLRKDVDFSQKKDMLFVARSGYNAIAYPLDRPSGNSKSHGTI